ncbi:PrsW family intramembrane metalloprotease [uncultured Friedmanniella sp.]|uniref:PrsW family intramembrane metalloprotease n=1 Tax=uncultured Friedmanniella sp. TaxID=335381 RepID=UPI0035C9E46F
MARRMTGQPYLPAVPPGPGLVGPVPRTLLRRRTSALTWVAMIILGVGALVVALLILYTGGPIGALVTTVLAAISFPLLIAVCFWLDRYEPEPARYRIAALGWGAVIAVILSFVAEQLLFSLPGTSDFTDTAILAPLVEELGKGLFLVVVLLLRRNQVHGLLDGIVYAGLVGIGFAFVEDILYYTSALSEGGGAGLTVTFVLRGVMSPFAHPLFTSATGIGIGIAASTRRPVLRWLAPLTGYVVAAVLHGIWNGSSFWGSRGFLVAYAAVFLPLLAVVLFVGVWARIREGRMLRSGLEQTADLGWNTRDEIRWIATLSDRISSRGYARRRAGKPAAEALRAYQQTMTEIAFLHLRALDGTAPRDVNQRMGALLQHAGELRPYVILPPPLPAVRGYGGPPPGSWGAPPGPPPFGPSPYGPSPYGPPPSAPSPYGPPPSGPWPPSA